MSERGFTVIEMLVGITLSVLVFGLIATLLVNYQQNAERAHMQNDAQAGARVAMDGIVRELRSVSSTRTAPTLVEGAGNYDLTFQKVGSPSGSNTAGIARVRYCVPDDPAPGSASKQVLIAQTESWTTLATPANPWAPTNGVYPACPFTPSSLPAGASITTRRLAADVTNRHAGADRPAFGYKYATPGVLGSISAIDVRLFVDVDATRRPAEVELRSSAFLRNQNQPPVASFTATPTGGGHVILNAGGSSDADGQVLAYAWTNTTGGGSASIGSPSFVDWSPGAGTYTVQLTVTDPGGLSATETQTVIVR